jgi:hypothetical protein
MQLKWKLVNHTFGVHVVKVNHNHFAMVLTKVQGSHL